MSANFCILLVHARQYGRPWCLLLHKLLRELQSPFFKSKILFAKKLEQICLELQKEVVCRQKEQKITAKFMGTKTVQKQLQGGKKHKFKLSTGRIISRKVG